MLGHSLLPNGRGAQQKDLAKESRHPEETCACTDIIMNPDKHTVDGRNPAKNQLTCLKIFVNNGGYFFHMDVSKNSGTPKSSILTGFSIINHPFCGTPIFGNTHINCCRISSINIRWNSPQRHQIQEKISQQLLSRLERQPWSGDEKKMLLFWGCFLDVLSQAFPYLDFTICNNYCNFPDREWVLLQICFES